MLIGGLAHDRSTARRDRRRRVHGRGPRPRCSRRRRRGRSRRRLDPGAVRGGRGPAGRRRRRGVRRGAADRGRRRRGARVHAQRAARARGRAGPDRRQAGGLREASGHERGGRPPADRSGRQALPGRDRAVRVPLLSHRPRGQGPHRGRRGRATAAAARDLPAGLAVQATGQQLAGRPAAWRRLSCIRGHRGPLVRPDGVRHRPSHHPAQRPHGDRVRPPPRRVRLGRGRHRGCRDGHVRDRSRVPAARS